MDGRVRLFETGQNEKTTVRRFRGVDSEFGEDLPRAARKVAQVLRTLILSAPSSRSFHPETGIW